MEPTNNTPLLPDRTPIVVLSGKYRKRRGQTVGKPESSGQYAGYYGVLLEPERRGGKRPTLFFSRAQLKVA